MGIPRKGKRKGGFLIVIPAVCVLFAAGHPLPELIVFACFDGAKLTAYEAELARL